jgi:hypothetical protein
MDHPLRKDGEEPQAPLSHCVVPLRAGVFPMATRSKKGRGDGRPETVEFLRRQLYQVESAIQRDRRPSENVETTEVRVSGRLCLIRKVCFSYAARHVGFFTDQDRCLRDGAKG